MIKYKIAVLGSAGVGKSALTVRFVQGAFVDKYDPTIEDTYIKWIEVDGHHYVLDIVDTAGTQQFFAMRDLYIRECQGFVLVYSITSLSTLNALKDIRQQIIRVKNTEEVAMILVGNKCDLDAERVISKYQSALTARDFNSCPFIESSAKEDFNVKDIFIDIVRQINSKSAVIIHKHIHQRTRKRNCSLCLIL